MREPSALTFRADSMVWFLPLLVAGLAMSAAAPEHSAPDLLLLGTAVVMALLPPMAAITCLGLTNARMLVFLGFGCSIVAFEYLGHVLWAYDLPVVYAAAAWSPPRLTEALLFTSAVVLTRSLQQNWSWPLAYTACILLPLLIEPPHQSTALTLAAVLFAFNLIILARGPNDAPDLLAVLWANVLQLASVLLVQAAGGSELGLLVSLVIHALAYGPIVVALLGVARNPSDEVSEAALLFDTVPDPVVLVDKQGTVHRLNASARRFGGAGSNCHTLFHGPSDRGQCPVCTHLRDATGPAVFYLTDGMRAPREVELVPLRGTPGLYLHLRRYVTRRRLVAGANLQSNREFAAVFANTHVALAYVDAELCFVCVNRVFAKAVGRTQEEFTGRSLEAMGFGHFAVEQCRKVFEGAGPLSGGGEQRIIPEAAEQRVWNWSVEPVVDGPRITNLVLSLVEVTDEQLAKEAARRFEDGYLAVQEHVSDGLIITDAQGRIQEANVVTENLTGYERWQLRNMSIFELHPPEEHDRVRFALVNLEHGFRIRVELDLLKAGGDRRVVEVAAASFRYGDARRTLSCLRDITERKRAEEALRQREARSRAILEQGGMGVAILSPRGEIIESNPAMLRISGYSHATMSGLPWERLLPSAPAADCLEPDGAPYTGRHRLLANGGIEKWVDLTLTQVRDSLGGLDFVIAMFMDVTSAHEAEEAAQLHERELARANAWKSRFIASASHDIRQPLQAVTILLHLLDGQPLDDGTRIIIAKIGTAMRNLGDMVNSILDLSKLDAGLVVPEFGPAQLDRVLQTIEDEFRPVAEEKGLALKVEYDSDLWVRTDRRLLGRILGNLVSNAIRYTDRGGVQVLLRPGEVEVAVKVVDTGIGIPDDECKRVFEEFHQGNAHRGRSEGMGLGLAIVEQLSRLLGVRIAVKSQVGIGTLFTVWIPLAQEEVASDEPEDSIPSPLLRSQLRALVIDDERDIRDALSVALSREGYLVVTASSCKEALATLSTQASHPDVIVADYRLHDGTGLDAIFALREYLGRRIPAILLTGETHASIKAEARERGCELVLKPATAQHLRRAIAAALDIEPPIRPDVTTSRPANQKG